MPLHFYALPIDEIRDESPEAYTLFFQNPNPEVFRYFAGQYLTVRVKIDGTEYRRAYSLCSAPGIDERLAISLKRVEGGRVSNYLRDHYQVGDKLELMPPMGRFRIEPDPERSLHYILIGAGSGITPLFSMLKTVLHQEPLSKVSLWYGNRHESSIIFQEELTALGKYFGERLHVYYTLSQPSPDWKGFTGRLDETRIYDLLLELFMQDEYRKRYFLCGPQGMMEAAERAMDKHSVNFDDVEREFFNAPLLTDEQIEAAQRSPSQEVKTYPDGEIEYPLLTQEVRFSSHEGRHLLTVSAQQSILDAALEAGLEPPYSCLAGTCSTCKARLVSGVVALDESIGLSEAELEQGYILTCQAHPLDEKVEVAFE